MELPNRLVRKMQIWAGSGSGTDLSSDSASNRLKEAFDSSGQRLGAGAAELESPIGAQRRMKILYEREEVTCAMLRSG